MAAVSHHHSGRRSPEEIGRLIREFKASALSQRRFALSRGINSATFGYWLRRGRDRSAGPARAHALVPVRLRESRYPSGPHPHVIEVVLRNGRILRVPVELEGERLANLVEILETRC